MFSKSKVKKVDFVTLSKFYGKYKEALQLELINSPAGLSRHICEPALNRPGLAIAGFYSYFANKRIQVFGSAELAYLQKLPEGMRKSRIQRMFRCEVPGIVFSRDQNPPREIVELADEAGVCVFRTSLVTMKFVNSATIILENEFAESVTLHGCMVDVRGVGVLIRGKSGVGKSETALGLIERGAALVADDMVYVRNVGGELVASAPEMSRGFMEVRGLGIVNITTLFRPEIHPPQQASGSHRHPHSRQGPGRAGQTWPGEGGAGRPGGKKCSMSSFPWLPAGILPGWWK